MVEEIYENRFNSKVLAIAPYPPQVVFCKGDLSSLSDLAGKKVRGSGRMTTKFLEALGASGVNVAFSEVPGALERGVIDGAEFSTPNVDYSGGFQQVTKYWSTPGWHQSASVFGVMINKAAWDALSPETQEKLKIAADATLLWSLAFTEKRATEAYAKFDEAVEMLAKWKDKAAVMHLNQATEAGDSTLEVHRSNWPWEAFNII